LEKIENNFQEYGVKILLFARLTPGIRAGIFIVAGITKLPWPKFLLADGIYAIPGVTLLFTLGWWFTDSMVELIKRADSERSRVMPIIIIVVLLAVAGYFVYRHLRRPMVEGSPREMPPVVGPVTAKLEQTLETMTDKILHHGGESKSAVMPPKPDRSDPGNGAVVQPSPEEQPKRNT
jgi:hypothetical protein